MKDRATTALELGGVAAIVAGVGIGVGVAAALITAGALALAASWWVSSK